MLSGNSISSLQELPTSSYADMISSSAYAFIASARDKYLCKTSHNVYVASKDMLSYLVQYA